MLPREDLAHLPLTDLRRMFFDALAYMCDYDEGGESVTALGLEFTPERCIFWVTTNAGAKAKIIDFLVSLLTKIMQVSAAPNTDDITTDVASQCINFGARRIRKYRSHLQPLLRRCISHLTEAQQVIGASALEAHEWSLILKRNRRA
jgi:hypothetical protein